MKKENIYKFLYTISILLVIGFIIRLSTDYFKYDNTNTSIQFYNLLIDRVLEFIMPSLVIYKVAKVVKEKYNN